MWAYSLTPSQQHNRCGFLHLMPPTSSLAFICSIYLSAGLSQPHLNVSIIPYSPWATALLYSVLPFKFPKRSTTHSHFFIPVQSSTHYHPAPVPAFFLKLLSPMSPGDFSLLQAIAYFIFLTLPDFLALDSPCDLAVESHGQLLNGHPTASLSLKFNVVSCIFPPRLHCSMFLKSVNGTTKTRNIWALPKSFLSPSPPQHSPSPS